MPAASNTRAVAVLILGNIEGCTQPASIKTLRAWVCVGHITPLRCATCGAGTLAFRLVGNTPRTAWPNFIAGANSGDGRPSFKAQRSMRSPIGRSTLASTNLRPISTKCPYCTPLGQVVSQLRQVKQRSKWIWVLRVGVSPSKTCFIK